jgi:hypothetical protein
MDEENEITGMNPEENEKFELVNETIWKSLSNEDKNSIINEIRVLNEQISLVWYKPQVKRVGKAGEKPQQEVVGSIPISVFGYEDVTSMIFRIKNLRKQLGYNF